MGGGGGAGEAENLQATLEMIKSKNKGTLSPYHEELLKWTQNVDKRYAWVILGALFLMMSSTLGPYRVYGLIFAEVVEQGIYTRQEAGWPVSMIFTVENVIGPFISILAYYISFRQCLLAGSVLILLGNGLTAFSTSLTVDILLIGVVQGIGYAFIFMPFMEIINSYFLRYRNLALGASLCGGTMSVFIWAPIFQFLLRTQPWRYLYFAIGLVGCINLLMVPLLKPNTKPELSKFSHQDRNEQHQKDKDANKKTLKRASIRAFTYQNSLRRQSTILINRRSSANLLDRNASIVSVNPFASSVGLERKISLAVCGTRQQLGSTGNSNYGNREAAVIGNDIGTNKTGSGSPSMRVFKGSNLTGSPNSNSSVLDHQVQLADVVSEQIDESAFSFKVIVNILKQPSFHLIWYSELVYFWVFSIFCLVLVDFGIDQGCSKTDAESLISFQSAGEIIGRMFLTIIVDFRFLSNRNTTALNLVLLAGTLISTTFISGYLMMAVATTITSALASLLYILLNGLLVDYLGEQQVTLGYGMASFVGGLLLSFRPMAVGFFRDQMGSYVPLMWCLAGSCLLGAICWLLEPLFNRLATCGKGDPDVKSIDQRSIDIV